MTSEGWCVGGHSHTYLTHTHDPTRVERKQTEIDFVQCMENTSQQINAIQQYRLWYTESMSEKVKKKLDRINKQRELERKRGVANE